MSEEAPLLDLALFFGAVYGASWLVTRSRLLASLRARFPETSFPGALLRCIVCTGVWMCALLVSLMGYCRYFSPWIRPSSVADGFVLVLLWVTAGWFAALRAGDAD